MTTTPWQPTDLRLPWREVEVERTCRAHGCRLVVLVDADGRWRQPAAGCARCAGREEARPHD